MFKKGKGFTLIELLAVIVIIAIIFTITFPVLKNIISNARYGAFESSKKGIERTAQLYYTLNMDEVILKNGVGHVEIGTLKEEGLLDTKIINALDNLEIGDDVKVLIYKQGEVVKYSLQMYNDGFFEWYRTKMINAVKKDENNLPDNVGEIKTVELSMLMDSELVSELRLPIDLGSRCEGFVKVEKVNENEYDYEAYVDCLTEASSFVSHYVSYGGKYLDEFLDVKETSDGGYIAVGKSNSETITKYGIGNNGNYDAIIVK
ncbi:MAG: prepilin-type N-terminal cleavage/methylation domain-containing protein, partial [Mollicutes bacterium]|nr:prepilin-type N-terminal cleavage/methylation domain-containing protein [Mollicutes bacterium]